MNDADLRMTGQSGRVVKRTVPEDKKRGGATIPTSDRSERDQIINRLKKGKTRAKPIRQ